MRVLDLFCGRWGWSRAFAARGWECVGVDLTAPSDIPKGCEYIYADVLDMTFDRGAKTCLICAEIAEAFSCDGRLYGGNLWDSLSELYRDMNISCVDKLTSPAAKAELLRRWNEWKFDRAL